MVASHKVIEYAIELFNEDYRYEDKLHPIKSLQTNTKDNTVVGRECYKK